MKKLTTVVCALALGIAWAAAPAIAQETTKEKAERKADQAGEKIKDTAHSAKDKAESAWDKTKEKTKEAKDKVKDKLGMSKKPSMDVRAAQQALHDKGFDPGPIDGVAGPRTSAAVKEFQTKENLNVTGSLDADTRAKLMASAPVPAASPATEKDNVKKQTQ
jgi:peptidoglycan hydrolase-like protein with peptidoglycan-binding domain